jgi:uncharacterized damage-inducible protein DinB
MRCMGDDAGVADDMKATDHALPADEREDLLQALALHRGFLRLTVRGLTDEQAAQRTTVSELCLGGLIKHVAAVEERWIRFVVGGAEAMMSQPVDWAAQFRMEDGETLSSLLSRYDDVARTTEQQVSAVENLGQSHLLPQAPWFEPGARWSVRRVLIHIIAETAQHAGHADIIRESPDGAKSMG